MPQKIAVIGAGVIGLTAAIRLLENNFDVTLFARDIKTNMASRNAPALWIPYKAAPEESILKWAEKSLNVYSTLTASQGIIPLPLLELYNKDLGLPLWTKILKDYDELTPAELPQSYVRGFRTNTYQIDAPTFLDYLLNQYQKLGGKIIQKDISEITAIDKQFKIIINCSGVWSCQLVPDKNSFPIRGQYVLIKKQPQIKQITFATVDDEKYILVVPRINDCYIGGTTLSYDWDTRVDTNLIEQQITRAQQLEPLLKNIEIISTGVGLRPGRKAVRLEAEQLPDHRTVIHNYGHGGSGFTVSWGCADDVVDLCMAV